MSYDIPFGSERRSDGRSHGFIVEESLALKKLMRPDMLDTAAIAMNSELGDDGVLGAESRGP